MAPFDKYMDEVKKVYPNDIWMQEHMRKQACHVMQLSNGTLLTIDKPKIRKHFYFGEDDRGHGTPENLTMEHAIKMCKLGKSWDYFFKKNIEDVDDIIRLLEDNSLKWYICKVYTESRSDKIVSLHQDYDGNLEHREKYYLTAEDVATVLEGYRTVRKKHEKRLKTWWKRYGEKHIVTDTYWLER